MAKTSIPKRPRPTSLSIDRIVEAAIGLLDEGGADHLTFRTLATALSTGSGAIYWHVADKQSLLATAADRIVAAGIENTRATSPRDAVAALAGAAYDMIAAHPWVGAQIASDPWQPAVLRILDQLGAAMSGLGIDGEAGFDSATSLLGFVLGLAGQYVAGSGMFVHQMTRIDYLRRIASGWIDADQTAFPHLRAMAEHLPHHDDRDQFLKGMAYMLDGILAAASKK